MVLLDMFLTLHTSRLAYFFHIPFTVIQRTLEGPGGNEWAKEMLGRHLQYPWNNFFCGEMSLNLVLSGHFPDLSYLSPISSIFRWTLISSRLQARCKKKVGSDCTKCRMYRIIASGISCNRLSGKHHKSTQQVFLKPPASAGNQQSRQATKSPFSTWSFRRGKKMKKTPLVMCLLFCSVFSLLAETC